MMSETVVPGTSNESTNETTNANAQADVKTNAEVKLNEKTEVDVKTKEKTEAEVKKEDNTEGDKSNESNVEYEDLSFPEGYEVPEENFSKFKELAKSLNLNKEAAQKLVDFQVENLKAREASMIKYREALLEKAKANKNIGGKDFEKNVSIAVKAVERFGGQPLKDFLNETGLGNDERMIEAWKKVGDLISEDGVFTGKMSETKDVPRTEGGAPMFKFKGMN